MKPKVPVVPAGTAWYRLVPDKIFSPRINGKENWSGELWSGFADRNRLGSFRTGGEAKEELRLTGRFALPSGGGGKAAGGGIRRELKRD
jgi:hypothetical protein